MFSFQSCVPQMSSLTRHLREAVIFHHECIPSGVSPNSLSNCLTHSRDNKLSRLLLEAELSVDLNGSWNFSSPLPGSDVTSRLMTRRKRDIHPRITQEKNWRWLKDIMSLEKKRHEVSAPWLTSQSSSLPGTSKRFWRSYFWNHSHKQKFEERKTWMKWRNRAKIKLFVHFFLFWHFFVFAFILSKVHLIYFFSSTHCTIHK